MPVTVPKPPPPKPKPPSPPAPEYVTRKQMDDALASQRADLMQAFEAMHRAWLAAIPKPSPAVLTPVKQAERKPTRVVFETDNFGVPTAFTITPEN